MVHGLDVVDDLLYLIDVVAGDAVGLKLQDPFQRSLSALDLRAEQCLLFHVHGDEQFGIGQHGGHAVQAGQGAVGLRQSQLQPRVNTGADRAAGAWA